MSKDEKSTAKPGEGYVPALERRLYDFFVSLGDQDLGDFEPDGKVYKRQPYELGEVPLQVIGTAIGFKLQSGLAQKRLAQLHEAGIYRWRKPGVGKPSFLSLLIEDHDQHFKALKASRVEHVKARLPKMSPDQVAKVHSYGETDAERRIALDVHVAQKRGTAEDANRLWYAYLNAR